MQFIDHRVVRIQLGAFLLKIGQLYVACPVYIPPMGQLSQQHLQQSGFSNAVLPDDADLLPSLHLKGQGIYQGALLFSDAYGYVNILHLQQIKGRLGFIGKPELCRLLGHHRLFDPLHPFQCLHPALGAFCGGSTDNIPGNIILQLGNFLLLGFVFLQLPGDCLRLESGECGIISLVPGQMPPLDLTDGGTKLVQEIPVVGYDQQ